MYFLHHYLQKGFKLEYLLNLKATEKLFMIASMEQYFEEEKAKWSK
ncbi:hypothetical protein [Caloranaerobacter sp. DY30410]